MAVVYRGRDTTLDREVAVKLLHPHLAARAESRARFSREARAVARLKHPNIVEIYDYAGDAAVESYLVTEFVHGRTLRVFAEEERIELPEIGALLVRALADALAHAHAAGVIHRDLKPENILVLEQGGTRAVKVVDFGIARILTSDDRMTMTGALVGSPNHMAPEIIEGRDAGPGSDVFSLGTILYWLATGKLPFAAPNPTATLRKVVDGQYVDPRVASPLVSDELAAAVVRALDTDPERRTRTAVAFRDDLDGALASSGLTEPEAELQAFLADGAAYRLDLRRRVVTFTLSRADAALAARDTARAMKLLDRVLALDPANELVTRRLEEMASRARWRRRVRRAGGAAGAAIGVAVLALGAFAWSRQAPGVAPAAVVPPVAAQSRAVPAPALEAAPAADSPRSPVDREAAPPVAREPVTASAERLPPQWAEHGEAAVAPRAAPRKPSTTQGSSAARAPILVQVHVRPYAERALLDGVEVARGEQRVTFSLAPGAPHRIQVEHACCFPFVRDFPAGAALPQPLELKIPLQPRPSRLRVDADPATRVYVDGALRGTAGDSQRAPLEVPVPPGGETPYEATAELRLERDGVPPVLTTLRIRAGTDLTIAAPRVSPERQGAADAAEEEASPRDRRVAAEPPTAVGRGLKP